MQKKRLEVPFKYQTDNLLTHYLYDTPPRPQGKKGHRGEATVEYEDKDTLSQRSCVINQLRS